jgi:hypothetical protein
MDQLKIIGIQILDRVKEAGLTQKALTRHANCIRTRLGFHELNEAVCSRTGLILLELFGNLQEQSVLETDLKTIGGINIREMVFNQKNRKSGARNQESIVLAPETRIIGVFVKNRKKNSLTVQDTFTKFGCSIRTRLGINVSRDYKLDDAGLILLELTGDVKEMDRLEAALKEIEDIEVNKMVFQA